jgi:phosphoglycerol transferase MdoB-like AlkP superfamily enzyme
VTKLKTRLLELGPFIAILIATWLKISYFNLPPDPDGVNEWYQWTAAEGIKAAAGSFASLLIIFAPVLLLRPTRRYTTLVIIDVVITLIVIGDLVYFRYYGDIMSLGAASGAWQITLIWRSIVALLQPTDLLFLVDIVIAVIFRRRYKRAVQSLGEISRKSRRMAAVGMVIAGLLLSIVPLRVIAQDVDGVFQWKFFRFFGARRIGLVNYHIYEGEQRIAQTISNSGISAAEKQRALAFVADWRRTAIAPSPLFGVAKGKNLIVIMVESLQLFPIGLTIEGQEVMPNLDAFIRRSMFFNRFFGQTAEGSTSDGEFTSMQSLYPLPTGSVQSNRPANNFRGIPRILAEHGYSTVSAHGFLGDLWNMRSVHPKLGFQKSFFREDFVQRDVIGLGISDAEFFRQMVPRLEKQPQPFMAFLITLTTHHDWKIPDQLATLRLGKLEGSRMGRYLQSFHHFDIGFGELIAALEKDGLLDRSVVVIYGDHRGQYGQKGDEGGRDEMAKLLHGYMGYPPPDSSSYRYWEAQNQIPLVIHLPGDAQAGVRSVTAGHLDIAPTVLNLLGIANHDMVTLGRDLTQGVDEFVVFRSGSFIVADTLCLSPNGSPATARCNDTRTGALLDPQHFSDRFAAARERLRVSDQIISGNLIPEH